MQRSICLRWGEGAPSCQPPLRLPRGLSEPASPQTRFMASSGVVPPRKRTAWRARAHRGRRATPHENGQTQKDLPSAELLERAFEKREILAGGCKLAIENAWNAGANREWPASWTHPLDSCWERTLHQEDVMDIGENGASARRILPLQG